MELIPIACCLSSHSFKLRVHYDEKCWTGCSDYVNNILLKVYVVNDSQYGGRAPRYKDTKF